MLFGYGMIDESTETTSNVKTKGYGFINQNVDIYEYNDHSIDCFGAYNITYFSYGNQIINIPVEMQTQILVGINSSINASAISSVDGYCKVDGISYNLSFSSEGVNYNNQLWFIMNAATSPDNILNIKDIAGKEIELMFKVNSLQLSDHYILNTNSQDELSKILSLHNNDLTGVTLEFTDNVTDLIEYFGPDVLGGAHALLKAPKRIVGKNITSIKGMFRYSKITHVDASLLEGLPNIIDASLLFQNTKITEIPETLFKNCKKITNLSNCFKSCTSLSSIPENIFSELTEVTNFSGCFYNCNSIVSIPENIFSNCTKAVNFSECFRDMVKLSSVGNIFKNNINAENFSFLFNSAQLTDISRLTFSNTNGIDFSYAFSGTQITKVHNSLFQGKGKNYSSTFYNCNSLVSVDDHTFDSCDISKANDLFYRCQKLKYIRNNLFKSTSKEKVDISGMFKECSSLLDISGTRFKISAQCEAYSLFDSCSSLTDIPGNLIEDAPNINDIEYMFADCTSLASIPSNLFDTQTYRELRFTCVFKNTGISTIPENLFKNNLDYSYCWLMFSSCSNLTIIPFNLFDSVSNTIGCVQSMFSNCTNVTSKVPELWTMTIDGYGCYSGCTKAANYIDIPTNWK